MPRPLRDGFTLVELLIVILVIGILAAIAVPQFVDQTVVAGESQLRANLDMFRKATERYYQEHKGVWPGCVSKDDGVTPTADDEERTDSFVAQMLTATDARGMVDPDAQMGAPAASPQFRYGPYRRRAAPLRNPLPDKDGGGDMRPDQFTVVDQPGPVSGDGEGVETGWKFNCRTGQFIANSDDLSSDGATTYDKF